MTLISETSRLPEAENSVKFGGDEGQAGFVGGLGECLSLDRNISDSHDVGGEKAGETSGSVTDGKLRPVLLIRGRGSAVVFVVQKAGDIEQRAFLGRNPQI